MPAIIRYNASPPDGDSDGNEVVGTGSPNVFVNSLSVARVGDSLVDTDNDNDSPITIVSGSPTVFANNIPVARQGDSDTDGTLTGGSPSVFADG